MKSLRKVQVYPYLKVAYSYLEVSQPYLKVAYSYLKVSGPYLKVA